MKQLLNKIRVTTGLILLNIGGTILGFRVITFYNPKNKEDDYVKVVHFAVDETQLNNSMRSYVEDLDASYNK